MQRSEINGAIARALEALSQHRLALPPFAHWSESDYRAQPEAARYLRAHQLGWDVTDFGSNDFRRRGLTLFCLRNGVQSDPDDKPYAEKLLFVGEGQETPTHRHRVKMEDIINRGGATLVLEFSASDAEGRPTPAPVTLFADGVARELSPWEPLRLQPGESVAIPRGIYHRFYARDGFVLAGEVSQVNDDRSDNYFLEPLGRFAAIEEDARPMRLLWNELP